MIRRLLITLVAMGAAAGILLATLSVDTPARESGGRPKIAPLAVPPHGTDPERPVLVDGAQITVKTPDGIIDLHTDTFEPLPDGAARMTNLRARLYGENDSVVSIRGNHGHIYAPDDQPRSGWIDDGVVVRIFADRRDLRPGSPGERLRCFFDEVVRFDRELGLFESPGAVRLSTPRLHLSGTSIYMNYSELDSRIERLSGLHRGTMRLAVRSAEDNRAPPDETTATTTETTTTATDTTPPQYYRATFHDDVIVRSRDTTIHADLLTVLFAQAGNGRDGSLLERISAAPRDRRGPAEPPGHPPLAGVPPLAAAVAVVRAQVALASTHAITSGSPMDSLLPHTDDEVTIRWTGRLLVEPLTADDPQIKLVGGPEDALVILTGRPLRIETDRNDVIRAAQATYTSRHERLTLDDGHRGDDRLPVKIDSPTMGAQIRASRIVLHQRLGKATVEGPGLIRALDEPGLVEAMNPNRVLTAGAGRLPSGMDIRWDKALDLAFFASEAPPPEGPTTVPIAALREVAFRGGVQVHHPSFDLASDRLDIDMTPRSAQSDQAPRRIEASGAVRITARNGTGEGAVPDALNLESDLLVVHLDPRRDGGVQPSRLEARGTQRPLVARFEGRQLTAGILDVTLEAAPVEAPPAAAPDAPPADGVAPARQERAVTRPALTPALEEPDHQPAPGVASLNGEAAAPDVEMTVRLLLAERDVRIRIPEEDTFVQANRVVANVSHRRLELFGTPQHPARLDRPDGTLTGHYIEMMEASETVRVIGAGRALFYEEARPVLGDVVAPPRLRDADEARLRAAWKGSMDFDNAMGLAQFAQNVVLSTRSGTDTGRLAARDIRVQFSEGPTASGPTEGDARRETRVIRSLEAVGDVAFLSESRPEGRLATSMRIKGPVLTFINATEKIHVEGEGSLVFLDQRPGAANATPATDDLFRGRGRSLFEWRGGMTLDALHNDMLMRDQVRMTHLPAGTEEVLMLDCQQLLADLEATGGMTAWMGEAVPQPEVRSVKADGNVVVINGPRKITTDHLLYTHGDRTVTLEADAGWSTQVSGQPSISARRIRWHLATNRFEVEDVGAGRVGR